MKKLNEYDLNGVMVKNYVLDNPLNPIEFIEQLVENGIVLKSISVEEDVEFDMKINTGHYTLEQLKQKYPQIEEANLPVKFTLNGSFNDCAVQFGFDENLNVIYMASSSSLLELSDIIEKKTQTLNL